MRSVFTGWVVVAAALIATTAFAQGRGPGGGGGGCANMGGGATGTAMTAGTGAGFTQMAAYARMMGRNSGSGNVNLAGYEPEIQQALARQAYARQQAEIAQAKAQRDQERDDRKKATIIAMREKELARRGKLIASKTTAKSTAGDTFATSR